VALEIIVIGTSRGGLKALQGLLPELSDRFQIPIVVVQHRGKESDTGLCEFLSNYSPLPVSEPDDKEPIMPGHIYLAPRDYHLLIENRSFALSTAAPIVFARPSIDLLFECAADEYGAGALGVILTGRNRDGALGLAAINKRGGCTIVQEPTSAEFREMPDAAIAQTEVDWILPLKGIADRLTELSAVSPVYNAK
jgi:two-component system chemotaxis response regulator CheB